MKKLFKIFCFSTEKFKKRNFQHKQTNTRQSNVENSLRIYVRSNIPHSGGIFGIFLYELLDFSDG